ncbi:MAG: DUF4388 domain-containing protein [Myxococcota bacterium]|nr:DUF4388 domain-containing protein [Myxococcota bacterium]MDW8362574.1 DUF4388 domain-containing protein [Myxococcales bacterium]
MAKQTVLLVDPDPRSRRVLEVSLRKAGYSVTTAADAEQALELADLSVPDLVVSETRLPGMDGFAFVDRLRRTEAAEASFMFLSSDTSLESKVRGLQLGVEYLTKPIYIREILTRVQLELGRKQREGIGAARTSMSAARFTGTLADMSLPDLLTTIDVSRKSGTLWLVSGADRGTLWFRDGQLLDAETGRLRGEAAIYRMLVWNEGSFEIVFGPVERERRIEASTPAVLMEGMRRLDEWGRLLEQLPPLDHVFDIHGEELAARLAEIPDEINPILRQLDGRRSVMQVVDAVGGDDLEVLTVISKLYFEGIVYDTGRIATSAAPRNDVTEAELPPPDEAEEAELVPATDSSVPSPSLPTDPERADSDAGDVLGADGVPVRATSDPATGAPPGPDRAVSTRARGDTPIHAHGTVSATIGSARYDEPGSDEDDGDRMGKKGKRKNRPQEARGPSPVAAPPPTPEATPAPESGAASDESAATSRDERTASATADSADEVRGTGDRSQLASTEAPTGTDERPARETRGLVVRAESNVIPFPTERVGTPSHASPTPETAPKTSTLIGVPVVAGLAVESSPGSARHELVPADVPGEQSQAVELTSKSMTTPTPPTPAAEPPTTVGASHAESHDQRRGRGTSHTTSSQSIRAIVASPSGEHAAIGEEFFRTQSYPPSPEDWSDLKRDEEPMSRESRRAMRWTFALAAVGLLAIGAYWAYQNVLLPRPVDITAPAMPTLPHFSPTPPPSAIAPEPAGTGVRPSGESAGAASAPHAEPHAATGGTGLEAPEPRAEPDVAEPTTPPTPSSNTAGAPVEPVAAVGSDPGAPPRAPTGEPGTMEPHETTSTEPTPPSRGPAQATGDYAALLETARRARRRDQEAAYRAALAANPDGVEALAELGFLLLNAGRNREAAELAERASSLDPTSSQAWITLGAARQALGDRAGARQAYENCVQRGQGRFVRDCRQML